MPRRKSDATEDDARAPSRRERRRRRGVRPAADPDVTRRWRRPTEAAEPGARARRPAAGAGRSVPSRSSPSRDAADRRRPTPADRRPEPSRRRRRASRPLAAGLGAEMQSRRRTSPRRRRPRRSPRGRCRRCCCCSPAPALGIWGAPKLAPHLPVGPGAGRRLADAGQRDAEARVAALEARLDDGLGGVEARLAGLASADGRRRADRRGGRRREARLDGEIAAAAGSASAQLDAGDLPPAARAARGRRSRARRRARDAEGAALGHRGGDRAAHARRRWRDRRLPRRARRACAPRWARCRTGSAGARHPRRRGRSPSADREIETAQAQVDEIQSRGRHPALGAAEADADLALIRAAIASGQPFARAARRPRRPRRRDDPARRSTAAAPTGVATLARLRDELPDAAHAAIRASILASAGDGVLARTRAFLERPGREPVADAAAGHGARRGAVAHGGPAAPGRPRRRAGRGEAAAVRGGGRDGRLARGGAAAGRCGRRAGRRSTPRCRRRTEGGAECSGRS